MTLQEEKEIKILRDSLARNLPESVESEEVKPREQSPSQQVQRPPVVKEVQAIPPEQVLAPTPRDEPETSTPSVPIVRQVRIETSPGIMRPATLVVSGPPGRAPVSSFPFSVAPRPPHGALPHCT